MSGLAFTLRFALLVAALGNAVAFAQDSPRATWGLRFDNDKWGSGSDRHYTHGTRITRRSSAVPGWMRRALDSFDCLVCTGATAMELTLGQEIYTPEETWRVDLIEDDRPYAGFAYVGTALLGERDTLNPRRTAFNVVGIQLGVVGPASGAESTQRLIHQRKEVMMPQGWDNQLQNELGVTLDYKRGFRRSLGPRERHDVSPYFVAAVGNVLTHVGGGVRMRSGVGLEGVAAPERGWHVFTEIEARAVTWNIFLDGNTRAESHSVEKEPVVGRAAIGMEYGGERLRFRFATEVRSLEFAGQHEPDQFSSLTFSLRP
jgi:hypothetical protein